MYVLHVVLTKCFGLLFILKMIFAEYIYSFPLEFCLPIYPVGSSISKIGLKLLTSVRGLNYDVKTNIQNHSVHRVCY